MIEKVSAQNTLDPERFNVDLIQALKKYINPFL